MTNDTINIIIPLITLGFFGSLSHCAFMCGPFVMMQVNNQLKHIQINKFNKFNKLKAIILIPYHLGRATSYGFLGLVSSILGQNIKNYTNYHLISGILLFLSAIIILKLILQNFNIKLLSKTTKNKKNHKKNFIIDKLLDFIKNITKPLFLNPKGLNGYLLGLILGFIPCGLLYSALLIAANIDNNLTAMIAMFCFGISNIAGLTLVSFSNYLFFRTSDFLLNIFIQFILLINMIILVIIAIYEIKEAYILL
ncbi:sulfite exporter TauE/SafE family protein [Rickettsiales bacterium]|nr:sulfite exporter TauE/SafE family protein [Rickettsiales bacterium]